MQDVEGSSFVIDNPTTMKPIKIKLKEEAALSLNGVDSKTYKKGKELTSTTTMQRRLFEHLIESGKAEEVTSAKKTSSGQKTKKPDEGKSKKKSKSKSKKKS